MCIFETAMRLSYDIVEVFGVSVVLSQPHHGANRWGVYPAHHGNLLSTLVTISLVDAHSINPEQASSTTPAKLAQGPMRILSYPEKTAFADDGIDEKIVKSFDIVCQDTVPASPSVRQSGEFRPVWVFEINDAEATAQIRSRNKVMRPFDNANSFTSGPSPMV